MRSTKASPWVLGTVLLAVVLLAGSWFLLVSPVLARAAETNATAAQVETENDRLDAQIKVLAAQFQDIEQYRAQLAALRQVIPADDEMAGYLRHLQEVADQHAVGLVSVSPTTPYLFAPAAPAAEAPAPAAGTEGSEEATTGSAPAAPAAAPPIPQGMAVVPLSLTAVGTFDNVRAFLETLQVGSERFLLVESLTGSAQADAEATGGRPATALGDLELSISGYLFVLPEASVPPAVDAEDEPAQLPVPPEGKNPLVPLA